MPNALKGLVSKKKIRFQRDGFDLDLTYITNKIIAMGYPAQNWEAIYRNHIDDVVSFFKIKHEGHYKIFNLCKERQIDEQKFEPDSINHQYPFDDHNPPRFHRMIKCCEDIQTYLGQDDDNIVSVQCKAGKGRTGVIVCSVLLLQEFCPNATEALTFYGKTRTTNGKGVTIPSQIRYVYYFDHWLQNKLKYSEIAIKFNHMILEELPNMVGNGYEIQVVIYGYDKEGKLQESFISPFYDVRKDSLRSFKIVPDEKWILYGDFKFQVVLKSKFGKREKLCHCWLNTFFIANKPPVTSLEDRATSNKLDVHFNSSRKHTRAASDQTEVQKPSFSCPQESYEALNIAETTYKFTLQKNEIDKANKDLSNKIFPSNFAMSFSFESLPTDHELITKNVKTPHADEFPPFNRRINYSLIRKGSSRNRNEHAYKPKAGFGITKEDNNGSVDEKSESSESSTNDFEEET